jgi:phenylalanyl-tRNA synthetase beta chain
MKVNINWLKELLDLNISIEDLVELLPLRSVSIKEVTEKFIELDMKGYNRTDLLSMRGVAREVSAISGSKLTFKSLQEGDFAWNQEKLPITKVSVENKNLCPYYTITKIRGVKAGKSPADWVKKLSDAGVRSVDTLTDITNIIMLEYGQPLHAFDASSVKNEEIIVRTAYKGEKLITLDGKIRDLDPQDLLIADSQKVLGLAGVMGGKVSEVNENTSTILLEAAIFDPATIRKTSTRLGLFSEASKRFQHGLTKEELLQALDAAVKMYAQLGGKITAIAMTGDFEDKIIELSLTKDKLDSLVGINIDPNEVENYLTRLGFTFKRTGANLDHLEGGLGWHVIPSYYRLDVNLAEDVIEEVARMYGYEKIPAKKVGESKSIQKEDPIFQKITSIRDALVNLGLTEIQTYSFYTTEVLNALGSNDTSKRALVKLANPISQETEYLRINLWPNLVEVSGKNLKNGLKDIAIFEIGKVFQNGDNGEPTENYHLAIALMNGTDNPLAELHQIIKDLRVIDYVKLTHTGHVQNLFHPRRSMMVDENDMQIGELAEVHLRVLNKLGIEKRVAILEIELT